MPCLVPASRFPRFFLWLMRVFVVCLFAVFGFGGSAQAQVSVFDWVVNINDAGFDPISAGGTVEYVVEVDNNTLLTVPATTVSLAVPANTRLTVISGDFANCTVGGNPLVLPLLTGAGGQTVMCDVPSLTSLAQAVGTVELETLQLGVIELTASVPVTGDLDVDNNMRTEETTVRAGSDLQLSLLADATADVGDFVDFDISVLNNGPDTANSFTIEFPIPTGVSGITGAGGGPLPAGCSISAGTVRCLVTGPVISTGAIGRSFRGLVTAASGSTITSSASVLNASPNDPISGNNTQTANTVVGDGTDVSITLTRPGTTALVTGQMVRFTVASSYTGNAPSGLTIETTIPAAFSVDAVSSPDGWVCGPLSPARVLTCTLPDPSGQGINAPLGSIFIDTTVGAAGSATISTEVSVGAVPVETNVSNNTASLVEAIVAPVVDLRANKSGPTPALGIVGDTVRYRISTTNIGTAGFVGTIRMVDDLPAGLSVANVQQNGWTCTPNTNVVGPQPITCELVYLAAAPLGPNETTPVVTLNALVTPAASGQLPNRLTVTEPAFNIEDTNRPNNTTTYTITAQGAGADIGVNKVAALSSLPAGEIQAFYIEAFNLGGVTSQDVRVNDRLTGLINNLEGLTGAGFVSVTFNQGIASGISCSTAAAAATEVFMSCSIQQLPVCTQGSGPTLSGGTCPVFEVQVRPGGSDVVRTNRAVVSSLGTPDPDSSNNRETIQYSVEGRTDVTVAKNFTPDPVRAGQDVTYVVTATNLDVSSGGGTPSTAANVTVTDDLPDNVRFISATPSAGTCGTQPVANAVTSGDQVICNLGSLAGDAQATVTIVVQPTNVTRGSLLRNTARVSTSSFETNMANNTAFVEGTVQPPVLDILVNKDDSVDPVLVGQTTTYTLTVTNAGPSASENVVVTDVLPDAIFAYRSHSVSGAGTCGTVPIAQVTPEAKTANRTLDCSYPTLAEAQTETNQVVMEAVAQGTIPNTVSISSDEIVLGFDTEDDNNMTSETTTARQRADISVASKTPSVTTVGLREGFTYVIRVENNPDLAGFAAENTVLLDNLPAGMVLTGPPVATVSVGSISQNTCTGALNDVSFQCSFGTASADAVVLVTVPVKVTAITTQGQLFMNTAQVSTTSFDSNPNNNSEDAVNVTVNGSSLAGTLYRDFDDSATAAVSGQDLPTDTGILGVSMTLTGTAVDGQTITETVTTDNNGDYIFPFLPAGTYSVTRGTVNETGLTTGQNTIGSEGGTIVSGAVINAITLPAGTAAIDYDFAEVPGTETPAIALIKTANLSALSNPAQAGQLVTYNFQITNTGNVPRTNVTLTDTVANVTLTGTPIPVLNPGQTNTTAYSATYPLQPGDIGGQISNTATVTGTPPGGGGDVSDISGTTFTNDTPTTTNIPNFTPAPAIALNKTVNDSAIDDGAEAGDVLSYGFIITNTGNVPLYNVTITDQLPGIVLTGAPITVLNPGESNATAYTASYTVTAADILAREVINDARVTGTYPPNSGSTVTDDDAETVAFLNIEAIPEVFPPFTDGGTTTTMLASDRVDGVPATLDNVTLVVLREDPGVTLDPVTTLITLAPGLPAGRYEVDYRICSIAMPGLCDEATEVVVQAASPGVETTKTQELVDNGDTVEGVGDTIIYQITLENTGNIALENVTVVDELRDFDGFGLVLSSGPDFVSASAGSPEGRLEAGEMATYSATFVINDQALNAGGTSNTVDGGGIPVTIDGVPGSPDPVRDTSDDGDDTDGNTDDDPTEFTLIPPPVGGSIADSVSLAKTTTRDVVRRGEVVPYMITVMNDKDIASSSFTLVDTLPTGFAFVPGSASLTPTSVEAGQITWTGIQLPPRSSVEIMLSARILTSVRAGDHINRANLLNPATGQPVVPEATATVRITPEAVFDCGEVIGKVFVDLNGDGYQNAPGASDGTVTDQSYAGGKAGKLGAPLPKTEAGIPNVRLVTVDGSIITTDEYGRYSVPCAMLPEGKGSNFILKLDDRTLPAGFRVTTENPRVVRLTPGMMSELNFGATIGRVVRVDLDGSAFGLTSEGKVALSDPLKRGIAQLLPRIADEAVNLRLTFHVPQDADAAAIKAARKMMQAADKHIKREWRDVGRTRLRVEQTIARTGQ